MVRASSMQASQSQDLPQATQPEDGQLTDKQKHMENHAHDVMHPRFYTEMVPTDIKELEYVRSPFYELAKTY